MSFGNVAYRRASGTLLVLIGIAACAEPGTSPSVTSPDGASLTASDNGADHRNVHLMRTQLEALQAASGRHGGGSGIFYHGGAVLQAQNNVAAVYWGTAPIFNGGPTPGTAGAGSADGSLVGTFLRNIGGSAYYGINSSYTDGS